MTLPECQQMIDAYVAWLREGLAAEPVDEGCELTTPFLDRHNDHLQIYATRNNGAYRLSADGYILADLRTSGLDLVTPKRRAAFEAILNGFGVKLDGRELMVEASPQTLGRRIHSLVQAMLAVGDMFVLAQPRVASFFYEDVRAYLAEHDVRFTERVKFAGRSGYDHAVDFLIPKWKDQPDRLVQAINGPTKSTVTSGIFALSDIREARSEPAHAYAFLNDRGREIGGDLIEALDAYGITVAPWSRRDDVIERLAA